MQFHIDQDTGNIISGWIAPDNPSSIGRIRVSAPGRPDLQLPANLPRPDLRELGLHSTGLAGFGIDESNMPGLATLPEVSVHDADSGVLMHRRCAAETPLKLFLFDSTAHPEQFHSLCGSLAPRFALSYGGLHRHPFDTLFAILNNQFARSILACGQIPFARYESVLRTNGFICTALLRHPFETLAIGLQQVELDREQRRDALEPGHPTQATPAGTNKLNLQTILRQMGTRERDHVANPLVKALACQPDEVPTRAHIAVALDRLASFDLVGIYSAFAAFTKTFAEMTGLQVSTTEIARELSAPLVRLAAVLARMPDVRKLLSLDMILYGHIEDALLMAKRFQEEKG